MSDLFDEDDSRRDNLACGKRLSKRAEGLNAESQKIQDAESLLDDFNDDQLTPLVQESRVALETANQMCASLAPAVREIMEAMSKCVTVMKEKVKTVNYSDLPEDQKAREALLVRLLNKSKALDEYVKLAEEVEKLASQTSDVATKASAGSEMTDSELEEAIKQIKDAEEKRKEAEREKAAAEIKEEKEKTAKEAKETAEKAKQVADEVNETYEGAKASLEEANRYAEEDNDVGEELKEKLESAKQDIEKAQEPVDETNQASAAAQSSFEETEKLANDDSTSVEQVKEKAQETSEKAEQTNKAAEEAKALIESSTTASKEVTTKLKEKRALDEALKVVDEARERAEEVKKEAQEAADIAEDAGKVADELSGEESEEIKAQVDTLKEASDKARESAAEAMKAGEEIEQGAETLKEKRVQDAAAEEVSQAIDDVHAKMEAAKEKVEEAKVDAEKTTEIAVDAKKVLEKIRALRSASETAESAKQSAEEAVQVAEETEQTAENTSKVVEESGKDTEESRHAANAAGSAVQRATKFAADLKQSSESLEKSAQKILEFVKRGDMPIEKVRSSEKQLKKDIAEIKKDMEKCRRAAKEAEELVEDVRANDPKSWDINPFEDDDEEEPTLICLVRGPQGTFNGITVSCTVADELRHKVMGENEDVLSNVIRIGPEDSKLSQPALIAIPYASRARTIHGREVVVKATTNGTDWKVVPTTSIERIFENYKGRMCVELRVKEFATYAVVSRLIRDRQTIDKKGGVVASSGDRRVSLTYPHNCFPRPRDVSLEVQQFDNNSVNFLKQRRQKCQLLVSATPILRISHTPTLKEFKKPVTVCLPVPVNPAKKDANKELRPSAFTLTVMKNKGAGGMENDAGHDAGTLHVMVRYNDSHWYELKSVKLSFFKNDTVTFEISSPFQRIIMIRTASKPDSNSAMVHITSTVEDWIKVKMVSLILHQHIEDRSHAIVQAAPFHKVDELEDKLINEGFEGPPDPSSEIEMIEGEEILVTFDGN
ncbi:uncharacterized abhydrolase domain-containing protein DDB_G0269086-like [Ptychodera flava]|uniref:uncharacterized abhydrolase domain-containing protein DDB_G0269086-like n=1 Tax=Ptychodera flava TaxID=63121 RepID=UPI003969FDCF